MYIAETKFTSPFFCALFIGYLSQWILLLDEGHVCTAPPQPATQSPASTTHAKRHHQCKYIDTQNTTTSL